MVTESIKNNPSIKEIYMYNKLIAIWKIVVNNQYALL